MAATGRLRRTLEWGDCDPAGIIYYPTYYRWMDAASWALMALAGWPAQRMRDEHVTLPLVSAQCDFLSSPTFGDHCEVRSHISRWGGSSFTVSHEIVLLGPERPLARGSESRVWCRYEAGPGSRLRSARLPDDVRAALGAPGP
ncbi:MAG TPA: acyl-CoA thioesterase [Ramlibacter sp.]|jgi:YbgC/YbaW family acyl-CoA thioester hydrolase|uniref:acyl-CoA thioesterase n=1 Tax=Ramlibacter sp. TaxID=1917967 RepID=UPI002D57D37E|nr:acyl-CoA thioesterase [Ramlibacter sp.]HZY17615.1 acyl-CoA thioesterase [Ramlibacter sp.]